MKRKRLLICPNCLAAKGKKEVLGEIDEQGNFVIKRYQSHATTRIISPAFAVQCGVCGEISFYRTR